MQSDAATHAIGYHPLRVLGQALDRLGGQEENMAAIRWVPDHVRSVIDPDGAVVLNLKTGKYYSLNSVGAEIWQQFEAGNTEKDIVLEVSRAYGVSTELVREHVKGLIMQLAERRLLYEEP